MAKVTPEMHEAFDAENEKVKESAIVGYGEKIRPLLNGTSSFSTDMLEAKHQMFMARANTFGDKKSRIMQVHTQDVNPIGQVARSYRHTVASHGGLNDTMTEYKAGSDFYINNDATKINAKTVHCITHLLADLDLADYLIVEDKVTSLIDQYTPGAMVEIFVAGEFATVPAIDYVNNHKEPRMRVKRLTYFLAAFHPEVFIRLMGEFRYAIKQELDTNLPGVKPSVIICSGYGYHYYFKLSQPASSEDDIKAASDVNDHCINAGIKYSDRKALQIATRLAVTPGGVQSKGFIKIQTKILYVNHENVINVSSFTIPDLARVNNLIRDNNIKVKGNGKIGTTSYPKFIEAGYNDTLPELTDDVWRRMDVSALLASVADKIPLYKAGDARTYLQCPFHEMVHPDADSGKGAFMHPTDKYLSFMYKCYHDSCKIEKNAALVRKQTVFAIRLICLKYNIDWKEFVSEPKADDIVVASLSANEITNALLKRPEYSKSHLINLVPSGDDTPQKGSWHVFNSASGCWERKDCSYVRSTLRNLRFSCNGSLGQALPTVLDTVNSELQLVLRVNSDETVDVREGCFFQNGFMETDGTFVTEADSLRVKRLYKHEQCNVTYVEGLSSDYAAELKDKAPTVNYWADTSLGRGADSEEMRYMMTHIGYGFLGLGSRLGSALVWYGERGIGKSSIFQILVDSINMQNNAASKPDSWSGNFSLQAFIGKRFNFADELSAKPNKDEDLVKQIIGGGGSARSAVQINRKFLTATTTFISCAHYFTSNVPIVTKNASDRAFYDRFTYIHCLGEKDAKGKTIHRRNTEHDDTEFASKLSAERHVFISLCINLALAHYATGAALAKPASSKKLAEDAFIGGTVHDADRQIYHDLFVFDDKISDNKAMIPATKLLKYMNDKLTEIGLRTKNAKQFGEEMAAIFGTDCRKRITTGQVYLIRCRE